MIAYEDLPARADLKPIRKFDGLYPEDEDERTAYFDFLHWYLTYEHLTLFSIPTDEPDGFSKLQLDENGDDVSAFNTIDYQRQHPWNSYHWKLNQACEKVKDLAITYSILSDEQARKRILNRFTTMARNEYQTFIAKLFEVWNQHAYTP